VAKTMGIVASAFIAAGLWLRPISAVPPGPAAATRSPGGSVHSVAGVSNNKPEGPWLASCKYWAAVRGMDSASKAKKPVTSASCPIEPASDDKRWGVPLDVGSTQPKIHVIIAAVPDPIHTHLALQFDRDIDALVQAAGDNGYVPSYYWLPWQSHAATPAEESVSREAPDQNSVRESQPGLIVFKHVPEDREEDYPWSNYFDVIYLFLVGETPTLGTDGAQLRNAFQAEVQLHRATRNVTFSMKGPNELAIIGSNASGSAASLREGIEAAHLMLESVSRLRLDVNIAGSTSTDLANDLLSEKSLQGKRAKHAAGDLKYISFGDDTNFEIHQLLSALSCSGHHLERVALLFEDSTVFGASGAAKAGNQGKQSQSPHQHPPCTEIVDSTIGLPVIIRFPREISLLRNAHADGDDQQDGHAKSVPSPFLHLSLKDPGGNDTVPQFSSEHMPLSQEAQLMAIGRQLQRNHTEFIVINASNVLDQIFLAQFLRRSCPDARLVLLGGDLLYEREAQNRPFIGAVTFSPYGLMSLTSSGRQGGTPGPVRAFADSATEAYFNAASFTFWNGKADEETSLHLANYFNPLQTVSSRHASLWATTIGTDGYYPLGIVNDCASNVPRILPTISSPSLADPPVCEAATDVGSRSFLQSIAEFLHSKGGNTSARPYLYPAQSWQALCVLIGLLCLAHAGAISFPNYWSPMTRDLAIAEGDERHRRSMYIYIGSTMLFCMAFLTGYPIYPCFRLLHPSWQIASYSLWALVTGSIALVATLGKTHRYLWPRDVSEQIAAEKRRSERLRIWIDNNSIFLVNVVATVSLVAVPLVWVCICNTELVDKQYSYVGTFFSYRCLHPGSGVSPLVPMLLILLGWYLWSVFQTLRLRFSKKNRPRLPEPVLGASPWQLFVSDADISRCGGAPDSCLTSNISCLLITSEILRRSFPRRKWCSTVAPIVIYLVLLFSLMLWVKLESLDRILWQPKNGPTMYELLLDVIALPLGVAAFTGWLRVMLIWGSLKRGLLERLEQLPIRFAFTRLKGVGWMSMLRQGGLAEQWRDMARSTESMRQMIHDPALLGGVTPVQRKNLERVQRELDEWMRKILMVIGKKSEKSALPSPQQEFASLRPIVANKQATVSSQEEESGSLKCMVQVDESNHFSHEVEVSLKYEIDKLDTFSGAEQRADLNQAAEIEISWLLSEEKEQASLRCMVEIEKRYAEFCELLLGGVLIPYWELTRTGPVEGEDLNDLPIKAYSLPTGEAANKSHVPLQLHTSSVADEPMYIRVAEEFLAIRYVSLIRAVLVNMRYLLVFVSAVFVLMIVAWNSYPFQPRQSIDEVFTGLLVLLVAGITWVFAQMHRNPILSRITDTSANELGFDFYVRLVTFGAVPVLTWLAYQFPELGGSLFKFIQPGLEVIK
jgi:hypothetical protein